MGLVKCVLRSLRNFVIFFLLIALLPGLPPKTHFDIESFTVTKPRDLNGPLAINNLLDNTKRLFGGRIHGPAYLISNKPKVIYTTVADGDIIKINGKDITYIAQIGESCANKKNLVCGRPLGIAFDTITNDLIVAESTLGIWSVEVKRGKKTLLVSPDEKLDGKVSRKPNFFNKVAVSKSGDIFWTDSSSDYNNQHALLPYFTNPSGRLFQYNRSTKSNKLLLDNLFFANGIALSPDEEFIVVAESAASKLTKYYLKGPLAGTSDIFVDGLPGLPDNLTPDAEGIWVPLSVARDNSHPFIWDAAAKVPLVRKFILRVIEIFKLPFRICNMVYPNYYCQVAHKYLNEFISLKNLYLIPKRTTVMRIDWNGNIIGALHGFDKSVQMISHVLESDGNLYFGSSVNSFLGKIALPPGFKPKPPSKPKMEKVIETPIKISEPIEIISQTTTTPTHERTERTKRSADITDKAPSSSLPNQSKTTDSFEPSKTKETVKSKKEEDDMLKEIQINEKIQALTDKAPESNQKYDRHSDNIGQSIKDKLKEIDIDSYSDHSYTEATKEQSAKTLETKTINNTEPSKYDKVETIEKEPIHTETKSEIEKKIKTESDEKHQYTTGYDYYSKNVKTLQNDNPEETEKKASTESAYTASKTEPPIEKLEKESITKVQPTENLEPTYDYRKDVKKESYLEPSYTETKTKTFEEETKTESWEKPQATYDYNSKYHESSNYDIPEKKPTENQNKYDNYKQVEADPYLEPVYTKANTKTYEEVTKRESRERTHETYDYYKYDSPPQYEKEPIYTESTKEQDHRSDEHLYKTSSSHATEDYVKSTYEKYSQDTKYPSSSSNVRDESHTDETYKPTIEYSYNSKDDEYNNNKEKRVEQSYEYYPSEEKVASHTENKPYEEYQTYSKDKNDIYTEEYSQPKTTPTYDHHSDYDKYYRTDDNEKIPKHIEL